MEIKHQDDRFTITCSRSELSILGNALNNIPQAVHESEYTSLIGSTKAETNALLDQIVASLSAE